MQKQDKTPDGEIPAAVEQIRTAYPNGHFYSPVVDPAELMDKRDSIWPDQLPTMPGIDFNPRNQKRILQKWFPRYMPDYDYPEKLDASHDETQFHTRNSQFSWLDARTLFVFLRAVKPRRMIEVGSGFSSLLSADVNHRFLNDRCELRCIEPYPREFLLAGIPGLSELIVRKVQDVPVGEFEKLRRGDILFIDSSHVCKTAGDVNFLYFEVLPRLRAGVLVHIHDIFLPFEYPQEWVMDDNRSWNEQYLLQALLIHSSAFKVLFGCMYAQGKYPELVERVLSLPKGRSFGGGSFWIRKR